MIPTDVPLIYVCAAGHRMYWSAKGYRHRDPREQDACDKPCVGVMPALAPIRPKLTLIKGGKS